MPVGSLGHTLMEGLGSQWVFRREARQCCPGGVGVEERKQAKMGPLGPEGAEGVAGLGRGLGSPLPEGGWASHWLPCAVYLLVG